MQALRFGLLSALVPRCAVRGDVTAHTADCGSRGGCRRG
ncbi:hypothetical protein C731_2488 [Mycolicibacterium hassiacum DSM 44199]|uniref:Uncharacterized protein n=1 Tax=Mycolicibacterium hassiacum (strain DSM 44199 / CIP 105218 / JCM 12690 / 3849) TaxID=1122247 RepID=K5BJN9_MYCHD|nr:hypothetical protein C731_2488 [Mycolicibacterium hassiacum DSM 44199]